MKLLILVLSLVSISAFAGERNPNSDPTETQTYCSSGDQQVQTVDGHTHTVTIGGQTLEQLNWTEQLGPKIPLGENKVGCDDTYFGVEATYFDAQGNNRMDLFLVCDARRC